MSERERGCKYFKVPIGSMIGLGHWIVPPANNYASVWGRQVKIYSL